jgi:hypothetical protein
VDTVLDRAGHLCLSLLGNPAAAAPLLVVVVTARLDLTKPYSRIYGAGDDLDIPRDAWASQDGAMFRADGSCVDDPPDPPKPPPIEQPGALIKVDDSIWKQLKAQLWGGYGGFDEDLDV